jgi:hypothetical protein
LAASGLDRWLGDGPLEAPAHRRLPFRELELALGLHAARRIARSLAAPIAAGEHALRAASARLERHWAIADAIEAFWSAPGHQAADTWIDHLDINAVMLAACLAPAGYLDL